MIDSYKEYVESVSSIPIILLGDVERDELANALFESYGEKEGISLAQIIHDLGFKHNSSDRLKASQKRRFEFKHRFSEVDSESAFNALMEQLAIDDVIDPDIDLPELFPSIRKCRKKLKLQTLSDPIVSKQLKAIRKLSGCSSDVKNDVTIDIVEIYLNLEGWYRCKDTGELILSKGNLGDADCDVSLYSDEFDRAVRREAFSSKKIILDERQLERLRATLDAMIVAVPTHTVFTRYAQMSNDDIAIDTIWGDGSIILVHADGSGFSISTNCDVHFRRVPGARPMPFIHEGDTGDIDLIWKLWPGMSKNDKILFLTYCHECKRPTTPNPILTVTSENPGVGKTYRLLALSETDDPCDGNLIVMPRRYDDFAMSLAKNNTLNWDNASPISDPFSDMACSACTGGFYEKRLHHKNRETLSLNLSCKLRISSVHRDVISNSDAISRRVNFSPSPLPEGEVWSQDQWTDYLETNKSAIFAGFLNQLSTVLKLRRSVKIRPSHRLSDFVITGEVVRQIQCGETPFEELLLLNQQRATDDVLDKEPFLEELVAMVYERGIPFIMDPTTVLHSVERFWQFRHDKPATMRMPGMPNGSPMMGKLLTSETNVQILSRLGVQVDKLPKTDQRGYRFSLNQNADQSRIGSNPRAGRNLVTDGEYDQVEQPLHQRPRTDEEWQAIFDALDAPDDESTDNVLPFKTKRAG